MFTFILILFTSSVGLLIGEYGFDGQWCIGLILGAIIGAILRIVPEACGTICDVFD